MENQNPKITRRSVKYDIKYAYHSDLMCQNYDAGIAAIKESDGRITLVPDFEKNTDYTHPTDFTFYHSDPDRIIAVANMMLAFAKMAKEENKKGIDISENV